MKKIWISLLMVTFVFGLSGCTSNDKTLSQDEAKEKALAEVNGNVTSYAQDLKAETPYFAFDIVQDGKRYEVKVNAKNGDIISKELDDDYQTENEINNNANKDSTSLITDEEAKKTALDKVGGGTVVKCELSTDEGTKKYDIEIHHNNKEYDVEVSAITNEILDYQENVID